MALAKAGARVIAVDDQAANLAETRDRAEREGVRVEARHGPLAELAFVRADTIDAAVSAYGLATVDDVDRVFRQVHRVLHTDRPFVFSLPHPAFVMLDPAAGEPVLRRPWWDTSPGPVVGGRGPLEPDRVLTLAGLRLGDPDQGRGDPRGGRRRHRLRHDRRRARRHRGPACPTLEPLLARIEQAIPAGRRPGPRPGAATPTGGSRPHAGDRAGRPQAPRRPSSSARSARATTSSSCASTSAAACGWCCTRAAAASATSSAQMHIARRGKLAKDLELRLEDPDLAYFVEGTPEFEAYIADMLWAQDYARPTASR